MPLSFALMAALAGPGADPAATARGSGHLRVRSDRVRDADLTIDGRVTPEEWGSVRVLPVMGQLAPRFGFPITHPTTVRVAYGDQGIYASFVCHDAHAEPRHVLGAFGRKDQVPASDKVALQLDPMGDGVTGYFFEVNASGAQSDAYIFRDTNYDFLWDGVWTAAAARTGDGWSAEIFVPWSTLRFEARTSYDFGVNVSRWVAEDAEQQQLGYPPQGVPGLLSYAAKYTGITGIRPALNLELRPYLSLRLDLRRPTGSVTGGADLLPNAGLETKYGLRGNLTMDLAVNPDFGQAEVDPAVLNLGPFEVFFPERRQFFLEAKEVFETRLRLFHSRRVGAAPAAARADGTTRLVRGEPDPGKIVALDPQTRLMDAVRMTGEVAPGWRMGLFTATTAPTWGTQRFSDGSEQRVQVDPTTQWSVIRVRREFDAQSYVGAMATSALRFGEAADATTGGVDYAVRFRERYRHEAQVVGTWDGREAGMAASVAASRGGRNLGVELDGQTIGPKANFNDLGFMQYGDFAEGNLTVRGYNAQPLGRVRNLDGSSQLGASSTYDGIVFRKMLMNTVGLTTTKLWRIEAWGGGQLDRLDPFETRGGIPYRVPLHWWVGGALRTPYNRRFAASINASYGEQERNPGPDLGLDLTVRPVDRVEASLGASVASSFHRPRWVARDELDEPIFGRANVVATDAKLRITVGFTPTLTLQSFNQLLYSTAHHTEFFLLADPTTLRPIDGRPWSGFVDQSLTAFVSNSVLRWEFRPGSFLFAVYTHRTLVDDSGAPVHWAAARAFTNLVRTNGRHEDIVFLKLVRLFGL